MAVAYTARARGDEGIVYTPRAVSEPMVRVALAPLLVDRATLLDRRVLDPCVGEGAFLVEIVRVMAERLGGPDARRRVAERCVFGRDIDPRAVERAIAAVEEFVGASVPALREHIVVGDALAITGSYDALVANPPYVRQELLANKQALRSFDVFDGVADLYVYFIELAHRVARRFCFVVPNKWLTAAYGRPLRRFLAQANSLEGVVDFAAGLFENADAFPCILWGTSDGATEPLRAGRAVSTAVDDSLACAPVVDRARWTAAPAAPWHADSGDDAALLDRLRAAFPPLSAVIPEKPSRGVVTGCNDAFVIDAVTRKRLLSQEPASRELIRPLIKGRDVRSWQSDEIDRYILLVDRGTSLDKFPRVRAHLERFRHELEPRPDDHEGPWEGRKPGSYQWYELQDPVVPLAKARRPRLFYQDIQTSPACCLDATGELVPDTTVWILPTDDAFVLALLNSPLYAWYAQRRFPPALNGAVRPKLEYMRELPVAQPAKALRAKITSLVHAQLSVRPGQKTDPRESVSRARRDDEIGALICDAYGLTPGERRLLRES